MSLRTKTPLTARTRAPFLSGATALVVVAALLLPASPASAATLDVATAEALRAALDGTDVGSTATDVVVLRADIDVPATPLLTVERTVTVDLNGFALTTGSVALNSAALLTIDDGSTGANGSWTAQGATGQAGFRTTGATLVIRGGTVTASGGTEAAGIGGTFRGAAGTIIVEGGTVNAYGGGNGAGIGTGSAAAGGTISISGGTITAIGGQDGAGLGGGDGGFVLTTTINGGAITAFGGDNGAGIGGGFLSFGGTITINSGEIVATGGFAGAGIGGGSGGGSIYTISFNGGSTTATGGFGGPGVGFSEPGQGGAVRIGTTNGQEPTVVATSGHPDVAGLRATELSLRSGSLSGGPVQASTTVEPGALFSLGADGGITLDGPVTNNGRVTSLGPITLPDGRAMTNNGLIEGDERLAGSGNVVNNGTICAPVDDIARSTSDPATGLTVTGNAYYLSVNQPGLGVIDAPTYSPRFGDCGATLPDASTSSAVNVGWGVSGEEPFIAGDTELSGIATLADGTPGTLEPVFADPVLTVEPTATQSAAGGTAFVTVRGPRPLSNEFSSDLTGLATFTGVGIEPGSTSGSFRSPTTPGDTTVTASVAPPLGSGAPILTTQFTHTTVPDLLDRLEASPSTATVEKTASLTMSANGFDQFDNPVDIALDELVVTSSDPFDVVNGRTVTFPFPGERTITVSAFGLDATATVTVTTPAILPVLRVETGTQPVAGDPVTKTFILDGIDGDIDISDAVTRVTGVGVTQLDDGRYVFEQAGDIELTITAGGVTYSTTVTVSAGPLDELAITPTSSTVAQGGSVTLSVTGQDALGNPVAIDPADVVVTSDVPTDVIDGLTVTFPTASPHTLTVTVGDVSASVVIEVEPAAVIPGTPDEPEPQPAATIPVTGPADTGSFGVLAFALLTLGMLAVLVRRAPRIRRIV